jgi:hypothetical protein
VLPLPDEEVSVLLLWWRNTPRQTKLLPSVASASAVPRLSDKCPDSLFGIIKVPIFDILQDLVYFA